MPQVLIPAGAFHMGGFDINAENDEFPSHAVELNTFWIDQLEVTNGMYRLCVEARVCTPPREFSSAERPYYFQNPEFKDYPVIYVTWRDAQAYCKWAGGRLPTEAEWERAARGEDLRTWPWGDDTPSALYANFDGLAKDTSRVGSFAAGASPFGVLDMAGNVSEWVFDAYRSDYYHSSPAQNPMGPSEAGTYDRVIRGGSYQDSATNIRVANRGHELGPNSSALSNTRGYLGNSSPKIGFRCAADP